MGYCVRYYNDRMIVGNVPQKVRNRTKLNMDKYLMSLHDAFEDAVRNIECRKELKEALFYDDFRKFIPSAYEKKYLDFEEYPLKYKL